MSTYTGYLLRVNLSSGHIEREPVKPELTADFIGGRGFGISYLYNELAPGRDPLGEENKLIFLPGVLAGTRAQGFGRWIVMTKSPLTGGLARSVGGGNFAAWMKFAGCDLIIVEGKAEVPSYIFLTGDTAEIRPADDLWGMDTAQTQKALEERVGKRVQTA